jgi:thioredoxin-dependent peroxiredoxin
VRDDLARYADQNAVVFGINGGSARSHRSFARRLRLPVPLLVDRKLKVARRYEAVLNLGLVQIVKRTVVGVDRDGRIVFYKRGTPTTNEILSAFSEPAATERAVE